MSEPEEKEWENRYIYEYFWLSWTGYVSSSNKEITPEFASTVILDFVSHCKCW
jgi:hypothetical protein